MKTLILALLLVCHTPVAAQAAEKTARPPEHEAAAVNAPLLAQEPARQGPARGPASLPASGKAAEPIPAPSYDYAEDDDFGSPHDE